MESEGSSSEDVENGADAGGSTYLSGKPDTADTATLQEMARRLGELERGYCRLLEAENESLRAELKSSLGPQPTTVGEKREIAVPESTSWALHAPAYLSSAALEVERRCDEMEMYARLENWPAARSAKLAAATTACRTLRRACGDREFAVQLRQLALHATQHGKQVLTVVPDLPVKGNTASPAAGPPIPSQEWAEFVEKETALFRVLGMSAESAEALLSLGHEALKSDPHHDLSVAQSPERFMELLETLRDDVCISADVIALGIRHERSRKRWKKILVNGVSGVCIVGANAAATVLLGPLGVAISGALGSAAVAVAAEAVNE